MRYLRLEPTTALWVAVIVVMGFVAFDVSAQFGNRGAGAFEMEFERFLRNGETGENILVETGTHFVTDDGRYRRDSTMLRSWDGRDINERTSEIWIPPEGQTFATWIPPDISEQLNLALPLTQAERITINHDMGIAVRGPFDRMWEPPSRYASTLYEPVDSEVPVGEPDGTEAPEMDFSTLQALVPEDLGEKTIGSLLVHGFRQQMPTPDGMVFTIEFWEAVLPQMSQSPMPIVVERFIRDDAGNGETMRVRSASRTILDAGFFDVPAGYTLQEISQRPDLVR